MISVSFLVALIARKWRQTLYVKMTAFFAAGMSLATLDLPASAESPRPAIGDTSGTKATDQHTGAGRIETSFASWNAVGDTKAAILSIHGFGLHKGAFDAFAKRIAEYGVATYAIDVRGFGSWGKDGREQPLDFYDTIVDVRTALFWIKRMHPNVPIFLLGESMGGAIALQAAAMFPDSVQGLITSVPGDEYFKRNQRKMQVALHMVRPDIPFDVGKHVIEQATSKSKLKNDWKIDPGARLELSPREMMRFASFMKRSHQLAKTIDKTPVLMIHGVQDRLANPDGTLKLFSELTSKDKDLVMLGNSEHLIFEKAQFDEHVIDVLISWIQKHCPHRLSDPVAAKTNAGVR